MVLCAHGGLTASRTTGANILNMQNLHSTVWRIFFSHSKIVLGKR